MEMTKGEITRKYREATNKKEQIAILAETNGCGKEEIVKILEEASLVIPKAGRKPKAKAQTEPKRAKIKPKTTPKTEEKVDFTQCEAIEPVEEEIEEVEEVDYPEEQFKPYMPVSVWETLREKIIEIDKSIEDHKKAIVDLEKEKAEHEEYIEINK